MFDKRFAVKMLNGAAVTDITAPLERLDIQYRTRFYLSLHVTRMIAREMLYILVCEIKHSLAAPRNHPAA